MRLDGRRSDKGKDVLVVCPNACRTETVGQALMLARIWSREYRVHVLLLSSEGPLVAAFQAHAVAVWLPDQVSDPRQFAYTAITEISVDNVIIFAVTLAVQARYALAPLKSMGIPSVALISDLASRCSPISAVSEALFFADHVAIPSQMVLADAIANNCHLSRGRNVHMVPPSDYSLRSATAFTEAEATRLQAFLRPEGVSPQRFIVLGAGPITYTNGVDVFLETARDVLARPEGRDALFVWSGPGFDPHDGNYGADLWAQLRNLGLENRVLIIPETPAMVTLYQLADLFVIPARADPTSSNGIAALHAGLPTLCFEGASSLAEYLTAAGLAPTCVAQYLDTAGLADRIAALAATPNSCAFLAARCTSIASRWFDPQVQADTIATLATAGHSDTEADVATISASPTFDPAFCLEPGSDVSDRRAAAQQYLERTRTGISARKPEPGFHPLIFSQTHPSAFNRDPYVDFLRLGRPPGPWCVPVITGKVDTPKVHLSQTPLRVALHIHAYFIDQLPNIMARLACNVTRPDLYISVTDAEGHVAATRAFESYLGVVRAVEVVPNIGRDIGPLLTAFGPQLVADYDIIGHVHTKQSDHLSNVGATHNLVQRWVELILSGVLGGPKAGPMIDHILASFHMNDKLGVVYPEDPNIFGFLANILPARRLLAVMNRGPIPDAINFPVGTMFWMRAPAFQPFVDIGLTWDAYPSEPLATDGTLLHAFERLFGVVPRLDGWESAVTFTPGINR